MFTVPFLPVLNASSLETTSLVLEEMPAFPIACVNWPGTFPDRPEVYFQMAHNGKELFVRYTVKETYTLAAVTEDNGKVWTDSCVELFLALDDTGYYNFEFTCIGKMLAGFQKDRQAVTRASTEVLASIRRRSTLGKENFEEISLDTPWSLLVAIPVKALFRHAPDTWHDIEAKINLYKCGDHLRRPHYLSWKPVHSPKPDFHRPESFEKIRFASIF